MTKEHIVTPKNNAKEKESVTSLCFVMPTYNREKTIGSALENISFQIANSKHREYLSILVSENHSTDKSAEIVERFASKYDFIKVVSPEQHLPSGEHNLFFALQHVTSEFIWSFADDDLLLPGAIDWIFENLSACESDFILINSQYQDADGTILRDRLLDMSNDIIYYPSFADIFAEVGPLTLLASFSSAIYRPKKLLEVDLEGYLRRSPIYAHVFAYLEAFSRSQAEILSVPLVVLRRSTAVAHWEKTAKRLGWYFLYPWTGGLATHLSYARTHGFISTSQYGFALNSNENGRYGLIANLLVQFTLQLDRAIEMGDPSEIPPAEDFAVIRSIVQDMPFVTIDTLDLLLWGEKYFAEVCTLLASDKGGKTVHGNSLLTTVETLDFGTKSVPWITKVKEKVSKKLHDVKTTPSYINFGTITQNTRPYTFMAGERYVVFQVATRFVVMKRSLYDEDWHIIKPNFLDFTANPPDWYIYTSLEEALKRYFHFDQENGEMNKTTENSSLQKILGIEPWSSYADMIEMEEIELFMKCIVADSELENVRKIINLIMGNENDKETVISEELFMLAPSRQNFILPEWYQKTYLPLTSGVERQIMDLNPILHYIMLGTRKNWSLSPYFDDFYFLRSMRHHKAIARDKSDASLDLVALARYFEQENTHECLEFFSVEFYLEQCKNKNVEVGGFPILHFLNMGISLGFKPHPKWSDEKYLDINPDVKQANPGKPYAGWLHWCMYGRFEKRNSGFTTRGE